MTTTDLTPRPAFPDRDAAPPGPAAAPPDAARTVDSSPAARPAPPRRPTIDVVVPVFNEERDLAPSVRRLRAYLDRVVPYSARITIADNASTDGTWALAGALADEVPGVRAVRLERKGRGRALRQVWTASDADVVAYMDVDLSTGLDAFLPLVAPLVTGHSDVAIGSRLAPGSRVVRGGRREVLSRGYNVLLRAALGVRFSDAQCGFKAMRADAARELLPGVVDDEWFFDTEVLVRAERAGLRIHEVAVDWVDDPDSRVDVGSTVRADLRGVARLARTSRRGQVGVFAAIGVASTVAHLGLFVALRGALGPQAANALALLLATLANTAANRRWTFGVRGRAGAAGHQAKGLVLRAAGWAVTAAGLALLHLVSPNAGRSAEVAVLLAGTAVATVLTFVLLRSWVFRPNVAPASAAAEAMLPGSADHGTSRTAPTGEVTAPDSAARGTAPAAGEATAPGSADRGTSRTAATGVARAKAGPVTPPTPTPSAAQHARPTPVPVPAPRSAAGTTAPIPAGVSR